MVVRLVKDTLIDKRLELGVVKIITGKFGLLAEKFNDDLEQSVVGFNLSILLVATANSVREVLVGGQTARQETDLLDGFFRMLPLDTPELCVKFFEDISLVDDKN